MSEFQPQPQPEQQQQALAHEVEQLPERAIKLHIEGQEILVEHLEPSADAGVLSDNAPLTDAFNGGPSALGEMLDRVPDMPSTHVTVIDSRRGVEPGSSVDMYRYEAGGEGQTFTMYPTGGIATVTETSIRGTGEAPESAEERSTFRKIVDEVKPNVNFNEKFPFKNITAVQKAYERLGVSVETGEFGHIKGVTLPLPAALVVRAAGIESDPDSLIYVPSIKLMPAAKIDNQTFVSTFASGEYPVAADDYEYYAHDVSADHLEAFMVYGEDLMEFMHMYAAKITNSPESEAVQFSAVLDREAQEAVGQDKFERAAINLDFVTTSLAGFELDKDINLNERMVWHTQPEMVSRKPDVVYIVHDMLTALGPEQMQSLGVVKAMVTRGSIEAGKTPSAEAVIQELALSARERFDIKIKEPAPEPETAPAPAVAQSLGL